MIKKLGILNEDGTMSEEFEVGEFDPETVEEWSNETRVGALFVEASNPKLVMKKFMLCPRSMSEHIPCLDNAEVIEKLESTERGERFERHCPSEKKRFNCLVPPPKGYRPPIPWPRSRDEVRGLRYEDFKKAIAVIRPSLNKSKWEELGRWNEEFGSN